MSSGRAQEAMELTHGHQARRWELRVADDGSLAASLLGAEPPVVVTGDSLVSLRTQVASLMHEARRQARRPG